MGQDIRELFKNSPEEHNVSMSKGHKERFLEKLNEELPVKKKSSHFSFLNIAASVVILFGLSYAGFNYFNAPEDLATETSAVNSLKTMGDVSPDLKRVEDYYLASINLELSKIQLTPDNKELFDGYLERLKELNVEYENLIKELNDNGPNQITLDALVENLKLRLNLVQRLKDKLDEFNADSFSEETI